MLLFHFVNQIKSVTDYNLINQIAKYFSGIPVKFSAMTNKIKSQVSYYIPTIECVHDLFSMEYAEQRFIDHVIYIGSNPTAFLKSLLDKIDRIFKLLRPKDIWMIQSGGKLFDDFDLTCLVSGATHKTLLAASKLKVYSTDDELITDLKIKLLFLAHRLEMRPININQ